MSTISPALNACFRVKRTREVDVHARNLDAWDQDYVQTSAGVFQGQVRELFDGPLQAFEEMANCATSQHCRPWQGGVWLGLSVLEKPEGLRFMGRPVGGNELMISDGSEAFDLQVPAGHGLYGLVFDPAELQAHMRALRRVGVPYTDQQIAGAAKEVEGKTEMEALIAYLQQVAAPK